MKNMDFFHEWLIKYKNLPEENHVKFFSKVENAYIFEYGANINKKQSKNDQENNRIVYSFEVP